MIIDETEPPRLHDIGAVGGATLEGWVYLQCWTCGVKLVESKDERLHWSDMVRAVDEHLGRRRPEAPATPSDGT